METTKAIFEKQILHIYIITRMKNFPQSLELE